MNALRAKLTVLLLGLAMAGSVSAADNLWLGFKAGTLGLGLEATWRPLPWFDIRAGANSFDYDDDGSQAGVNYNATLHLETYYATLNFRFPLSPFRVTAGAFSNGNELQMVSMDSPSFDIGGVPFTQDEVGTLRSTTFFEDVAPYLGFGYDFNVFGKVGLNLDIGVLWQGEPSVTLTADGLLESDPTFMAALEAERLEIEAEFEDFKAFPVLSLGFSFNFF
ncbi:MAG: hypothetical protein E2O63_04690 [Gammaproteobacteria bacterium]|nr:hypothetical protein [Pseudomonadota bacterium]TDJ11235.1 MAG: hypothetical protein E2O63_04690 [Gammaproteobacteria bacterium]